MVLTNMLSAKLSYSFSRTNISRRPCKSSRLWREAIEQRNLSSDEAAVATRAQLDVSSGAQLDYHLRPSRRSGIASEQSTNSAGTGRWCTDQVRIAVVPSRR